MPPPRIDETPRFVGGPLHGRPVHSACWQFALIEITTGGAEVLYARTQWYRPEGRSFCFYAVTKMTPDAITALLYRALAAEKGIRG